MLCKISDTRYSQVTLPQVLVTFLVVGMASLEFMLGLNLPESTLSWAVFVVALGQFLHFVVLGTL
jgi:hypothetical protein